MIPDGLNYLTSFVIMMVGFFGIVSSNNLVKKLICLSILQASVLLFYISIGYIKNAAVPMIKEGAIVYVNPLPQVMVLTAIVVGVAVMAVGLAISVRIKEEYGTVEEDEIAQMDLKKYKRESKKNR